MSEADTKKKKGLTTEQIGKIEKFVEDNKRGRYRFVLFCLFVFLVSLIVGLHTAEYLL